MLSMLRTERRGLVDAQFTFRIFKHWLKRIAEVGEVDHGKIGVAFRVLDGDMSDVMFCQERAENRGVAAFVHELHLIISCVGVVPRGPGKVGPAHEHFSSSERGGVVEEGAVEEDCIFWSICGNPGGCLIVSHVGEGALRIVRDDEEID